MTLQATELLRLIGLTKTYDSTTVVKACDLTFSSGQIHALLGANGAGKSTLVRMIAGLVSLSDGSMRLDDQPYHPANKREAERLGIEIVQQELNLIPTLTVAENLFLNRLPNRAGVIRGKRLHDKARELLDQFGLQAIDPATRLASLGVGQQQIVEIAGALNRNCRLLILDEPTAALSAAEVENLFQWLDKLRVEGVGIIYISHRLDEIKRMADCCSVMRDGRLIDSFETSQRSIRQIVELMSGESSGPIQRLACADGGELLRVAELSGGPVKGVTLSVKRGEKLGISGLVGSGRTELLRLIFAADPVTNGNVFLRGSQQASRFRSPSDAVRAGIAMVTEDRKENGLLLTQSIRHNISLPALWERFAKWGVIRRSLENLAADKQIAALEIRSRGSDQFVGELSGGNQQKVAIAKWLQTDAEVFLFDEPTRGIDIGTRRKIYELFDRLADEGKAMVIVSSDNEELMEVCDRIEVMSNGRLVSSLSRGEWSNERITEAAFSGYLNSEGIHEAK